MSTGMSMLPEHASAQIVMLQGSLCSLAELAMFLDQFGYKEDPSRASRWLLESEDPKEADCSLQIDSDGETMTVFGLSSDHFSRINFLIQKAGWTECSVLSRDPDIEAKLLARLVSVGVNSSVTEGLPASSLTSAAPGSQSQKADSVQHLHSEVSHFHEPVHPYQPAEVLDEEHERIEALTIRANSLEEKVAALESENSRLLAENSGLRATRHEAPPSTAPLEPSTQVDARALLQAIEKHMTASLDLTGVRESQLVRDLDALGFTFQVRLAQSPAR